MMLIISLKSTEAGMFCEYKSSCIENYVTECFFKLCLNLDSTLHHVNADQGNLTLLF